MAIHEKTGRASAAEQAETTLAWTEKLNQAKAECEKHRDDLDAAKAAVTAARSERDRGRKELLDAVMKARSAGLTYRAIGEVLGVTPQRVLGMIDRAHGKGGLSPPGGDVGQEKGPRAGWPGSV